MLDIPSKAEAVAILSLLMVSADNDIHMDEISTMLGNPFFIEHVTDKIGPHHRFLKKFNAARVESGATALEKRAISTLKSAFPAFQLKMLAMLTLIAGADDHYDQKEKELMARIASQLGVQMGDVEPELAKMKEAILNQAMEKDTDEESNKSEA